MLYSWVCLWKFTPQKIMVWITLYPLMKRHFPKQITYLKYFLRREFLIRQTRFSKVRIQRHLCHATPRSRQCDGLLVVSIHPILKYYVMGIKINNRIWWGSNGHVYGSLSLSVSLCVNFISRKKKDQTWGYPIFRKKQIPSLSIYNIYNMYFYIYINKTLIIPSRERKNENNFK